MSNNVESKPSKAHSKNKFTAEEDSLIKKLVKRYGTNSWLTIASNMENRSSRQIKERWFNYLKPGIIHSKWTKDEEKLLLEKHKELGSRWKYIATFIKNRTEVDVKNHYRMMMRKKAKNAPIVEHIIESNDQQEVEDNIFPSFLEEEINMPDFFELPCEEEFLS